MDSVEATTPVATPEPPVAQPVEQEAVISDDDALGAVWDEQNDDGPARDETGKFVSPDTGEQSESEASPVEGEVEVTENAAETSTPDANEVPLPSNWQGMDEQWKKIPEELRHDIAERENNIHKTLSDQGRQISEFKAVGDVIEQNSSQFSHLRRPDGQPVAPHDAIAYLFQVNKDITANPVDTILNLAESFSVREQVAAKLNGTATPQEGGNESVLLERIAGLEKVIRDSQDPAKLDQHISARLQQDQQVRDGQELISRLSKDKPLYSEIPEQQMVQFIQMAQTSLGETASPEDVFNSAYDMAVNAIPTLRAKHAAAQTAATTDPKKVANAKRANDVNVASTSSGKSPKLTEEQELGNAYDKAQRN